MNRDFGLDPTALIEQCAILVVDDDVESAQYVARLLSKNGFKNIATKSQPHDAIASYIESRPDLVIVDLHIPEISGIQIMREMRRLDVEGDHVPVVMLTADMEPAAKRRALEAGCDDFIDKFAEDFEVLLRVRNCLRTRLLNLKLRRKNADLGQQVFERTQETVAAQEEVVQRLAAAAEYRDDTTGQHVQRVGNLAAELASAIGLGERETEVVRRAAKLHDIGKIGIPDVILYKEGPLTPEERVVMQTHTIIGDQILSDGGAELIRTAQIIARSHHERWDGSGYPDRLCRTEIPLEGRIVAVADVFDALITKRPYKKAFSYDTSIGIILEESGRHFDPDLVRAFGSLSKSKLLSLRRPERQTA